MYKDALDFVNVISALHFPKMAKIEDAMESDIIAFKSDEYERLKLLSGFKRLLDIESFCDVTLSCDVGSFKAHKLVLSAASSYFEHVFAHNPCEHPSLVFMDISYVDLKTLVDFIYSGEVSFPRYRLETLLKASKSLGIKMPSSISMPLKSCESKELLAYIDQMACHVKSFAADEKKDFEEESFKCDLKSDYGGFPEDLFSSQVSSPSVDDALSPTDTRTCNRSYEKEPHGDLPHTAVVDNQSNAQCLESICKMENQRGEQSSFPASADFPKIANVYSVEEESPDKNVKKYANADTQTSIGCVGVSCPDEEDDIGMGENPALSSDGDMGMDENPPVSMDDESSPSKSDAGKDADLLERPESPPPSERPDNKHPSNPSAPDSVLAKKKPKKQQYASNHSQPVYICPEVNIRQLIEKTPLDPPLVCPDCGYDMRHSSNVITHINTSRDCCRIQFNCSACPKTFIRPSSLIDHFHKRHSQTASDAHQQRSVNPGFWLFCEICRKAFQTKPGLIGHRRKFHSVSHENIHSAENPSSDIEENSADDESGSHDPPPIKIKFKQLLEKRQRTDDNT